MCGGGGSIFCERETLHSWPVSVVTRAFLFEIQLCESESCLVCSLFVRRSSVPCITVPTHRQTVCAAQVLAAKTNYLVAFQNIP